MYSMILFLRVLLTCVPIICYFSHHLGICVFLLCSVLHYNFLFNLHALRWMFLGHFPFLSYYLCFQVNMPYCIQFKSQHHLFCSNKFHLLDSLWWTILGYPAQSLVGCGLGVALPWIGIHYSIFSSLISATEEPKSTFG